MRKVTICIGLMINPGSVGPVDISRLHEQYANTQTTVNMSQTRC